jgi:hypothetical protein
LAEPGFIGFGPAACISEPGYSVPVPGTCNLNPGILLVCTHLPVGKYDDALICFRLYSLFGDVRVNAPQFGQISQNKLIFCGF